METLRKFMIAKLSIPNLKCIVINLHRISTKLNLSWEPVNNKCSCSACEPVNNKYFAKSYRTERLMLHETTFNINSQRDYVARETTHAKRECFSLNIVANT